MANSNLTDKISAIVENSVAGSHWKKFKQTGNQNQAIISVGHFSPEIKMDKTLVGGGLISGGPEPVAATGVKYSEGMTRGNLKDFYEVMKANVEAGYMPGYTVEIIENMRQEKNKTHPEEYDMVADVVAVKFSDEKTADQAMTSQSQMSEGNIFQSQIPGAPQGMDIQGVLNNPLVQAQMTAEQKSQLKKMQPLMKDAGKQMKAEREKAGLKNTQGNLFGYPATFYEMDDKKFCTGVRVKNFLLTGSLLYSCQGFPDGNTPCQSVSQFSSKKITEQVEGSTYHRTEVSPKQSTLASEGFLNKTEIEAILKKIFKLLESKEVT
jgi:hypothetical protein